MPGRACFDYENIDADRYTMISLRRPLRNELRAVWELVIELGTLGWEQYNRETAREKVEDLLYDFSNACQQRFERAYALTYGEKPPVVSRHNMAHYLTLVMPEHGNVWRSWDRTLRFVVRDVLGLQHDRHGLLGVRRAKIGTPDADQTLYEMHVQRSLGSRIGCYRGVRA